MFQRIQTVYMFIAAVACILLFFLPVAKYAHDTQGIYIFYITGIKYMIEPPVIVNFWKTFPLLLILVCSVILILTAIFLYKNRKMQLWLVNIGFLLNIALIILIFLVYINHFEKHFNSLPSYQIGIFIPLVSLVCLILASRAIRKDEAMVKSSDRLR
jgi:hypothetical protein